VLRLRFPIPIYDPMHIGLQAAALHS